MPHPPRQAWHVHFRAEPSLWQVGLKCVAGGQNNSTSSPELDGLACPDWASLAVFFCPKPSVKALPDARGFARLLSTIPGRRADANLPQQPGPPGITVRGIAGWWAGVPGTWESEAVGGWVTSAASAPPWRDVTSPPGSDGSAVHKFRVSLLRARPVASCSLLFSSVQALPRLCHQTRAVAEDLFLFCPEAEPPTWQKPEQTPVLWPLPQMLLPSSWVALDAGSRVCGGTSLLGAAELEVGAESARPAQLHNRKACALGAF